MTKILKTSETEPTTDENSSDPGANGANDGNKGKSAKKGNYKEPRGQLTTEIKVKPEYFIPKWGSAKLFILVKKDDFEVNDYIWFAEMKGSKRTGRRLWVKITYILEDKLFKDHIIIGFKILQKMSKN